MNQYKEFKITQRKTTICLRTINQHQYMGNRYLSNVLNPFAGVLSVNMGLKIFTKKKLSGLCAKMAIKAYKLRSFCTQ